MTLNWLNILRQIVRALKCQLKESKLSWRVSTKTTAWENSQKCKQNSSGQQFKFHEPRPTLSCYLGLSFERGQAFLSASRQRRITDNEYLESTIQHPASCSKCCYDRRCMDRVGRPGSAASATVRRAAAHSYSGGQVLVAGGHHRLVWSPPAARYRPTCGSHLTTLPLTAQ